MISAKSELMGELGEAQAMFTLAALMPMAAVEHGNLDSDELKDNPMFNKVYYDDLRASLKAIALRMIAVAEDDKLFLRAVLDATGVTRSRAETSEKIDRCRHRLTQKEDGESWHTKILYLTNSTLQLRKRPVKRS
jgi:hypothetical protein